MSAYIGDVVKNGLVLYLDAANSKSYVSGSSTWFDLSGNNNSGSLINGPTFSSDGKGSIVFDNTDDYINCGVIPSLAFGTGGFTMNVWFSIASTGIGGTKDWVALIAAGGWAAGNFAMILNRSSSHPDYNKIQFNIMNGTTYKPTLDPSGGIIVNKWYNVTVTRNSSTISAYVLGQFVGSYTDGANITATQPFWIGQEGTGSGAQLYPFHGKIPMVQIYNRALSPAEILENYNATKGRFDTPRAINSVQPRLVTNGLVMCLDAGNRESYVSGSNIIYDLIPTRSISICGTVGENGTLTLTAPTNYVFTSVDFASYGTPNGSCGSFTTSSCHSATSYTYVASQLLGKTGSVSIGATNANFGDPCGGTVKRLYVQATATGPSITGSLINGPTFNSSNNGSIVFDGSNDYIQILDNSLQISTGVTVTSIVKPNVIGENKSRLIDTANVSANTGIVSGSMIGLKIGTINPYQDVSWFISDGISNSYEIRRSNSVITSTSVPYIITARWRKSDGNASIFVNGVETSYTTSTTFTGTPGTLTNPVMIGFLRGFNLYGNQTIYATHLYNRYLSNEEILQNYNALKGRFGL